MARPSWSKCFPVGLHGTVAERHEAAGLPLDGVHLAIARPQKLHRALQNAPAFGAGHRRPEDEALPRRRDGEFDFGGAGLLDYAQHFAGGRTPGARAVL